VASDFLIDTRRAGCHLKDDPTADDKVMQTAISTIW